MTIDDVKTRIKQELNAIGADFERVNDYIINTAIDSAFRLFVLRTKGMFKPLTKEIALTIFGSDLIDTIQVNNGTANVDLNKLLDIYENNTKTRVRNVVKTYDGDIYHHRDAYISNIEIQSGGTVTISFVLADNASIKVLSLTTNSLSDLSDGEIPDTLGEAIAYGACSEIAKMPETGLEQYTQNYLSLFDRAFINAISRA